MTKTEMKQANRQARCIKRGQLHDANRASKRAREKAQRAIADRADVFGVVGIFLHRNDLATLDYANDKTHIRLTRKDAQRFTMGFTEAVGEDPDDAEEYDEEEDIDLDIYLDACNEFKAINDFLKRRQC